VTEAIIFRRTGLLGLLFVFVVQSEVVSHRPSLAPTFRSVRIAKRAARSSDI
jgi:hypothetical protein